MYCFILRMLVFNIKSRRVTASFELDLPWFDCLCKTFTLIWVIIISVHLHKPWSAHLPDPKYVTDELNQEVINHICKYYVLSMVSQGIGLGFNTGKFSSLISLYFNCKTCIFWICKIAQSVFHSNDYWCIVVQSKINNSWYYMDGNWCCFDVHLWCGGSTGDGLSYISLPNVCMGKSTSLPIGYVWCLISLSLKQTKTANNMGIYTNISRNHFYTWG